MPTFSRPSYFFDGLLSPRGGRRKVSPGDADDQDESISNQLLFATRRRKNRQEKEIGGAISGPRLPLSNKKEVQVLAHAGLKEEENEGVAEAVEAECSNDLVPNFRPARGLKNAIFRCGQTDDLILHVGQNTGQDDRTNTESSRDQTISEEILLYHAGLLIDLRSPTERHNKRADAWMSMAPGGAYEVQDNQLQIREPRQERTCLRLTPLPSERFFEYVDAHWLNAEEKARAALFKMMDQGALHQIRLNAINQRGLVGMNEAILEVGKPEFLEALKATTLHLEFAYREEEEGVHKMMKMMNPGNQKKKLIVIHCVKGKDRTGVLIMLMQSILKIGDVDIMLDYEMSDPDQVSTTICNSNGRSGIPEVAWGSLDHSAFRGAPKNAMKQTLQYLRDHYGSVSPGYLDNIGFDAVWRKRFQLAMAAVTREDDDDVLPTTEL